MNEIALKETTAVAGPGIKSFDELMARAEFFSKSALIPTNLRGKKEDVAIILQMGWELGIAPMQALNSISVVQGKPMVSPELMIGLIRQKIPNAFIKIESKDTECSVTMARSSSDVDKDQAFTSKWTIARAQKMGLSGKDNYVKQAGTMLKWRAVGEAARTVFPDITKGLYADEELSHLDDSTEDKPTKILSALGIAKPVEKEVVVEVDSAPEQSPEPVQLEEVQKPPTRDELVERVKSQWKFMGKPLNQLPQFIKYTFKKETTEMSEAELEHCLEILKLETQNMEDVK